MIKIDTTFKWNPSLKKKVQLLELGGEVQKHIDEELLRLVAPYWARKDGVAIKSGMLNTVIGSGMLTYRTPYIKTIYYGVSRHGTPIKYNTSINPSAGKLPFNRFWSDKGKAFEGSLNDFVAMKFKSI